MDIQPSSNQTTKPISDDQELAKVLAGITTDANNNFTVDDIPTPGIVAPSAPDFSAMQTPEETPAAAEEPAAEPVPDLVPDLAPAAAPAPMTTDLETIRKEALLELRPLVEKLDLAPEEKFNIYLLLLRSTDDTTLIPPAYNAAKNIADESKRAQALLDIIKEIDFLSVPVQQV